MALEADPGLPGTTELITARGGVRAGRARRSCGAPCRRTRGRAAPGSGGRWAQDHRCGSAIGPVRGGRA